MVPIINLIMLGRDNTAMMYLLCETDGLFVLPNPEVMKFYMHINLILFGFSIVYDSCQVKL